MKEDLRNNFTYKARLLKAERLASLLEGEGLTPDIKAEQIMIVFKYSCGCLWTSCKQPHIQICDKHSHYEKQVYAQEAEQSEEITNEEKESQDR